jgi:hypothetical protein
MTDSGLTADVGPVKVARAAADASGLRLVISWIGWTYGGSHEHLDVASEWDLTVPGDDAWLWAEFRRHGVRPGQRVLVVNAPPVLV